MFSSHSREIGQESVALERDFTGDDGIKGRLEGDVTNVNISLTGDRLSL